MKFRRMTLKKNGAETSAPTGSRRLLLAAGIFGATVLLAGGAFAARGLTSDGDDESVTPTAGEEQAGIDDLLANKEAPPVAVTDVGALPEGVSPPTLEQLTAGGADNPEFEQLSACGTTFTIRRPFSEGPLCSDGLPYRAIVQWHVCPDGLTFPITSFPVFIDRWPGFPTGQTFSFGGSGSTATSRHSSQFFIFVPVIYWQDTASGDWQSAHGEALMATTPFFSEKVHANQWSIWRDGRWQTGDEINPGSSGEVFGWVTVPAPPRSTIFEHQHPGAAKGIETYYFRYFIYWSPITDGTTGETVFGGGWGQIDDFGWNTCQRDRSKFIFQ